MKIPFASFFVVDPHSHDGLEARIIRSGRSAVWLAHLTGGQGAEGSNPFAPTIYFQMYQS